MYLCVMACNVLLCWMALTCDQTSMQFARLQYFTIGFDIAVPIFPFVVFLTRSCLIYFLLPHALLILFLVWGCAFGLVISGFIRLALFFLFCCFCSSRWDCCACLFSTLFSLPSIFFNNLSSFSSAGKRIVKPSKVAKDIHTDHVSPFCLSLWI